MAKVAVIIVTCNRKPLLHRLLESLMRQTQKIDRIIVVDNDSKDGTLEFVKFHFPSVSLLRLDQNIGLFGGLEVGVKIAMSPGFDGALLIDDDAYLKENALEQLLMLINKDNTLKNSVIYCANVTTDGQYFTEPIMVLVDGRWKVYSKFVPELYDKVYETTFGPNIGVFIPYSILERIAPRSEMVFCGEEEFIYRVIKARFKVFRCFSIVAYHKRHKFYRIKFLGKTFNVSVVAPWHTYYETRNSVYVSRKYMKRSLLKTLLSQAICLILKVYVSDDKLATLRCVLKGSYDGLFGKLGIRVPIPR